MSMTYAAAGAANISVQKPSNAVKFPVVSEYQDI